MARASSRRSHRDAGEPVLAGPALAGWMLVLLAIPRVVRILYPYVWVEDDFYLEAAYLVSIGMRPYLDFVHPHMPMLEWFTAGWITLFGASHFSVEVLNEAAIYVTSVLTCALGYKVAGRRTAICAGILYAFASLVFRYHVYERELFVGALVLSAALVAMREELGTLRQAATVAGLFVIACAIKLTAVVPAAAVLVFIAIVRRRIATAIAAGIGCAVGLGVLTTLLYIHYGYEFLFQAFIFHFMKGREPKLAVVAFPRRILDMLGPLLTLGVVRIVAERKLGRALWLVILLGAFYYLFFGVLSPTAWGHNYLDFLPYVAIVAALGLDRVLGAAREALGGPWRAKLLQWAYCSVALALIVVCLSKLTPVVNESWLHGSVYGFGFVARDELQALSQGLQRASPAGSTVVAPAFVCFEANRIELVRFPETYGVYREAEKEFREEGFFKARARLGRGDFFDLIERTDHYWIDPIRKAIEDGSVRAVIADSPVMMVPLVALRPEYLAAHGFAPVMRTEHFVLWQRIGQQVAADGERR